MCRMGAVKQINDMKSGLALIHEGFNKLRQFFERDNESGVVFTSDEYMKLHATVYSLCKDSQNGDANTAKLYAAYRSTLAFNLAANVMPRLRGCRGVSLLSELYLRWRIHTQIVRCLSRSCFSYLDRCYLSRSDLPELWESGLMCFKNVVFEQLKGRATETILALIERERKDEGAADRALVKNVAVGVFVAMGMGKLRCYEEDFEAAMLDATSEFYSRTAARWIEVEPTDKYMDKAEAALEKERERVENYLHPSSQPKVAERARQQLLVVHVARLFENEESGFRALVRDSKTEDLGRIFRLYGKLPEQLQQAAVLFRRHVTEEVTGLVQAAEDASTDVIKKLMELHNRYNVEYIGACFGNHELFRDALTEAFKEFGTNPVAAVTSAELIAIFCDEILKKGGDSEKMREDDIEKTFESTVQLLTYVYDKDMFVEFYRKKLSHRLLFGRSASSELEKSILAKLKQQFGVEFTSKMECMIKDMDMAKENNENFEKHLSENPPLIGEGMINISVTVLTNFKWPSYASPNLAVPAEMTRYAEAFSKFYSGQFPNRKLSWLYALGTCHIKAKFATKTIELVVSTYQALVLMLFNSNDTLSYSDIKAELNVGDNDDDEESVRSTLQSLSLAKYKILSKKPESKRISDDDVFEFNEKFNDPMRRIKLVPLPTTAEEKERKKVARAVNLDRRYSVDCAIVRVMKARKVLAHQSLVKECVEVLSKTFRPDVKLIKKRIHDLIERDFIERDESDSSIFKYVA